MSYYHHHFVDESIHGHPHHQGLAHQPNSLDDLDNDTIPFDNVPVRYDDSGKDDCTLVKKECHSHYYYYYYYFFLQSLRHFQFVFTGVGLYDGMNQVNQDWPPSNDPSRM